MAENNLPDILDTIPEPSLITSNGFKYYDENDITSWLSGFNVFVLAVDDIVSELKSKINLLENPPIIINKHPANFVCDSGQTVRLICVATGDVLSYQWQYTTNIDGEFTNITWSEYAKTNTYPSTPSDSHKGITFFYRCKITDKNDNVAYTNICEIYVNK